MARATRRSARRRPSGLLCRLLCGLLASALPGCSRVADPIERYAVQAVLSRAADTESHEVTVVVGHCAGWREQSQVGCEAVGSKSVTFSTSAGIGRPLVGIDLGSAFSFELSRASSDTRALDGPEQQGYLYRYQVRRTYSVQRGQARLLGSQGTVRTADYSFYAACTQEPVKRELFTCSGVPVAAPTPVAAAGPALEGAPTPQDEASRAPAQRSASDVAERAPMIIIPAGSRLAVMLLQPITSERERPGHVFHGRLVAPVEAGGLTLAEVNARAVGVVSDIGSKQGKQRARMTFELSTLELEDGQVLSVRAQPITIQAADGDSGLKRGLVILGGAILGAGAGAAIDGKRGAARGAMVGAGGGAVVSFSRGKHIAVPVRFVLEFQAAQDMAVPTLDERGRANARR